MNIQKIHHRGTEINRLQFSEIEELLDKHGMNANEVFTKIADDREFIHVSNGFINGLKSETTPGEWHHYFTKQSDGTFNANKLLFS